MQNFRVNENSMPENRPRILLVEDNEMLQKINTKFLCNLGCEVEIAVNGLDAISMAKNDYDVIFLDLGLPDIHGLTVAKAIRSEEQVKPAKRPKIIIALTASEEAMKVRCYSAGFDDFYTKPISPEALKQALIKWLPKT